MAKRQSTSNARAVGGGRASVRSNGTKVLPRSPGRSAREGSASTRGWDPARTSLATLIEGERDRLMRIESVLGCLHLALEHAGEKGPRADPDFASTAAIALSLVREVLDRLDSRFIGSLIRPPSSGTKVRPAAPSTRS
jgi:hypothetical protein